MRVDKKGCGRIGRQAEGNWIGVWVHGIVNDNRAGLLS